MIQRDWQSMFVTQIQTYNIIKYNSYFYSPTKSYLRENTLLFWTTSNENFAKPSWTCCTQ